MRHVVRRVLAWIVPPLLLLAVVLGAPFILEFWGWQGAGGTADDAASPDPVLVSPPEDESGSAPPGSVIVLTPASAGPDANDTPPATHHAPADADPAPVTSAPAWSVATLGKSANALAPDADPEKKEKRDGKHGHAKGWEKKGEHPGKKGHGKHDAPPGERGRGPR